MTDARLDSTTQPLDDNGAIQRGQWVDHAQIKTRLPAAARRLAPSCPPQMYAGFPSELIPAAKVCQDYPLGFNRRRPRSLCIPQPCSR